MRRPEIAAQTKTVLASFVMASIGAGMVVGVGLMARPSLSDIPYAVGSAGVVKASVSSSWAARGDIGVQ